MDSIWDQLQSSDLPPPQEDMAKWESQFNQLMSSQRDGDEATGEMGDFAEQMWNQESNSYNWSDESRVQFDNEGLPIMGPYVFGMWTSPSRTTEFRCVHPLRRDRQQIPRPICVRPVASAGG